MPGGTDGRTGTAGRRPVGPGVAGAAGAIAAPRAVAAVEGHPAGAGGGTPTGTAAGVAGDSSISSEDNAVLLRAPRCPGPPCERRRRRRRGTWRGRRDAVCGKATRGQGRRGRLRRPIRDAGGAHPTRSWAPRGPHEGPCWRAREGAAGDGCPGATQRVQRVARSTVAPPRLVMIAPGDFTGTERFIRIGW